MKEVIVPWRCLCCRDRAWITGNSETICRVRIVSVRFAPHLNTRGHESKVIVAPVQRVPGSRQLRGPHSSTKSSLSLLSPRFPIGRFIETAECEWLSRPLIKFAVSGNFM
jgi:hypothetical protein